MCKGNELVKDIVLNVKQYDFYFTSLKYLKVIYFFLLFKSASYCNNNKKKLEIMCICLNFSEIG